MNPSFFFRVGGGARRESGSERRRVVAGGGGWRSDAPGPRPCLDTPAGEGQNKEIHTAAPLQRRAGSKAVGGRGGRGGSGGLDSGGPCQGSSSTLLFFIFA